MEINTMQQQNELAEVTAALRQAEQHDAEEAAAKRPGKAGTVSSLLRIMGSLVLIAASIAFLVQRWGSMGDILRYTSFLCFTAALTLAGLLCGVRMKEDKGARTFLALAAGMVTVNFAQLGALLYSAFSTVQSPYVPAFLLWRAPSTDVALLTAAAATAVLIPVTAISMRMMARAKTVLLTLAFIGLNLLLLAPTRNPAMIGALFSVALVAAMRCERAFAKCTAARTPEGITARALLFAPAALLIGRNVLMYQASESLYGLSLLAAAYALFDIFPEALPKRYRAISQTASYAAGSFGWFMLAHAIVGSLSLPLSLSIPMTALPVGAALGFASLRVEGNGGFERTLAATAITASGILEIAACDGVVSSLYCVIIGLIAATGGYAAERKGYFVAGTVCLAMGLTSQVRYAVELYSMSPWVTLAVVGIATVLASSYVERYSAIIVSRVREFAAEYKQWN